MSGVPTLAATSASASATTAAAPTAEAAKLKKAAQAFEAVFARQLIGSMRAASTGDGLFDSSASQQFRDMADSRLADDMAGRGSLHIADMLMKRFGARAGAATPAAPSAAAPPTAPIAPAK